MFVTLTHRTLNRVTVLSVFTQLQVGDRRHGHERVLHGEALEVRLFLKLEFTPFLDF